MTEKNRMGKSGIAATIVDLIIVIGVALALLSSGCDQSEPAREFAPTPTVMPALPSIAQPTAGVRPTDGGRRDWWQVYFTDPPNTSNSTNLEGTIAAQLLERINNARSAIYIASFEFNLTPIADALIAAHRRGVDVRWVTDDEHGLAADVEERRGQFAMLQNADIEVRDDRRSALMHNKFWIFDGRTVWTGSTNVTVNGVFRNNNNAIVIDSPELAAIYEREFAELWTGEFGVSSPSTVDQQSVTIAGTPVQVLFAPEDDVANRLAALIAEARRQIRFMAFSFTSDAIGEAVLARAAAGVDVAGIFEARGSQTKYSELPRLYCAGLAGLQVRQDGNPRTFHHKVFVIDGEIVVTGSYNFSQSADTRNDENVLIIANRDIAEQYLREFDRRWTEAVPPNPVDINCQ